MNHFPLAALRRALDKLISDAQEKLAQVNLCFRNQPEDAMAEVAARCGDEATALVTRLDYLTRLLRSATQNIPPGTEAAAYADLRAYIVSDVGVRTRKQALQGLTVQRAASLEAAADAMLLFASIDHPKQ